MLFRLLYSMWHCRVYLRLLWGAVGKNNSAAKQEGRGVVAARAAIAPGAIDGQTESTLATVSTLSQQ